jgi:hypothetical protein
LVLTGSNCHATALWNVTVLAVDLLRASTLTLLLGTVASFVSGLFPTQSWARLFFIVAMALSIAAGVFVLARRHRANLVPIAAIYCVVMIAALIYVAFLIAWYRGQVEF